MIVNLNLLPQDIDTSIVIPPSFYSHSSILNISPVNLQGIIRYNASDEVEINLNCKCTLELEDAVTCEKINYPLNLEINENLDINAGEMPKYYEKKQNTLDIIEFLWENIVLEVPIRVTKASGTHMSGEGWELNQEKVDEEKDPRFAKLDEFFKGGE